jgi:hypothetical protein
LHNEVREAIGIDVRQCRRQRVEGIGGVTEGLLAIASAQMIEPFFGGPSDVPNTTGATFELPIIFVKGLPTNIFGRVGLMDNFRITFDPNSLATVFDWAPGPTQWVAQAQARFNAI